MSGGFRPRSLLDVAARTIAGHKSFSDNLAEFLDDFYLDESAAGRQARIRDRPDPVGDAETDLWLGATGEHLAQRWGLAVPEWTREPPFFGTGAARFYPGSPKVRPILLVESPPAFRSRLLFTTAEPLVRARFPGEKVRMPFDGTEASGSLQLSR